MKYRTPSYAEGVYDCYFFEKNLQGDIISIFNSSGYKIGAYNYDAWGNFTIDSAATDLERQIVYEINPFRYRGYYYDVETGWYYLQSRYYNPEWGRFLNADTYLNANGDIIGLNLFAYGSNNPIMFTDPNGEAAWWQLLTGVAVVTACITFTALTGGAAAAIAVGVTTAISAADGAISAAISGGDPLDGALAGAVGGAVGGIVGDVGGRITSSIIYDLGYEYLNTGTLSAENIPMHIADITVDAIISSSTYSMTNDCPTVIKAFVDGLSDATVDIMQTKCMFQDKSNIFEAIKDNSSFFKPSRTGGGRV